MASKKQYHFVLSKEDEDSNLKANMDFLVGQKQLTAKLKTALTLLLQLESGDTTLLDSMFPQIRKPSPPPTPDTSGLEKRLDYLQHLLEQGRGSAIADDAPMVAAPPLKKLAASKVDFTLPLDDDDDMPQMAVQLAPLKKGQSGTAAGTNGNNLLSGILGLEH